jgi:hypothetical protein
VLQRGLQVLQRLPVGLAVAKHLAHLDGLAEVGAGAGLQPQQALAAKQHIAVEEGLGQRLVGIMRRADPLVQILGEEI